MAQVTTEVAKIQRAFKKSKLSVRQFATLSGVHFTNIYDIFAGRTMPTIETMSRLGGVFGLKLKLGKGRAA